MAPRAPSEFAANSPPEKGFSKFFGMRSGSSLSRSSGLKPLF